VTYDQYINLGFLIDMKELSLQELEWLDDCIKTIHGPFGWSDYEFVIARLAARPDRKVNCDEP
jgi:hypothetical protein